MLGEGDHRRFGDDDGLDEEPSHGRQRTGLDAKKAAKQRAKSRP
jgi:hypothetical protein